MVGPKEIYHLDGQKAPYSISPGLPFGALGGYFNSFAAGKLASKSFLTEFA